MKMLSDKNSNKSAIFSTIGGITNRLKKILNLVISSNILCENFKEIKEIVEKMISEDILFVDEKTLLQLMVLKRNSLKFISNKDICLQSFMKQYLQIFQFWM